MSVRLALPRIVLSTAQQGTCPCCMEPYGKGTRVTGHRLPNKTIGHFTHLVCGEAFRIAQIATRVGANSFTCPGGCQTELENQPLPLTLREKIGSWRNDPRVLKRYALRSAALIGCAAIFVNQAEMIQMVASEILDVFKISFYSPVRTLSGLSGGLGLFLAKCASDYSGKADLFLGLWGTVLLAGAVFRSRIPFFVIVSMFVSGGFLEDRIDRNCEWILHAGVAIETAALSLVTDVSQEDFGKHAVFISVVAGMMAGGIHQIREPKIATRVTLAVMGVLMGSSMFNGSSLPVSAGLGLLSFASSCAVAKARPF